VDLATAEVALIDEVSMGLAPAAVADVYDRLRAIAARGTGVLLVEQQVARALAVADYVYVLGKGRVVFVGEPAQLDDARVRESYLGVSA
jgi:branched-chain amino acid transport system ATP-binding protein